MRPSLSRAFLASVLLLPAALHAQVGGALAGTPYQFTIEDYARAERFLGATMLPLVSGQAGRASWLADGRAWYRASTANGGRYWVVTPGKKLKQPLFDHDKVAASLAAASGGAVEAERIGGRDFEVAPDGATITLSVRGKRYACTVATSACAAAPAVAAPPPSSSVSPDGKTAVFIKEHNLWARDLATGKDRQLTTDGIKDFGYATNNAGWEHSDDPVVTWSPDSKAVATFQHDGRGVRDMVLVATNVGNPRIEQWKYPMPGDSAIFRISRVIVTTGADGSAPRVTRFQMPPDPHRSTVADHVACGGEICDTQWWSDGSRLAFVSTTRDHKVAYLRVADAATGAVRTVITEESKTQVGDAAFPQKLWRVLPGSREVLWWSDRDDWTQLYLYDLETGALKHQVTTGPGNVVEIVRIDEKKRQLWFLANGKEPGEDPYQRHLYRVNFDGKGQVRLTPDRGNHAVVVSPDGQWIVDTWSTPVTPPVTVLRDANGKAQLTLETADVSRLMASGWKAPTPIVVKARDGKTDLYGLMFTPSTLDSTKKYPVINHIYPGPQSGSVGPRLFLPARGDNQALAELGFVVVEIDGMGTPGRSKTFRDFYYGRMDDNTIPDQVAGMKDLARQYAFVDTSRAGIWGHSGGGFATASAMFRAPDFFKVGIAESGNHDNRNYEDDWGERYQGLLVKNGPTDNYAAEANQTYARNLKGKLFLIHGGMDDNVPPVNTTLVADALVKAGKDFDLLILPNARHGYGADGAYVMRRRWDYFVKNLQGNVPPKEYQIGRPRVQP